MKYPQMSNFLTFKEEINSDGYQMNDYLNDQQYSINSIFYKFIHSLDGKTDPYKNAELPEDTITSLLYELDENDLIRQSRFLNIGIDSILYSLFIIKQSLSKYKHYAKTMNTIVRLTYLPVLLIGLTIFSLNINHINLIVDHKIISVIIALFIAMSIHELGHACCALSYNARIFEFGIGLQYCIIPVAYIIYDDTECSINKKILISSAGIKVNLLVSGIAFLLAVTLCQNIAGYLFDIALYNLFLGIGNLLPFSGFDGYKMLVLSLGIDEDNFIKYAKRIVFKKRIRQHYLNNYGLLGYAIFFFSLSLLIVQVFIFLVIILINIIWVVILLL